MTHWYKEAIIYELHVKCFSDSSGSGMGDFKGLTSKLDYLQELGVTAIWILPFYPSPLKDDGYDIADYESVHPQYGTIADFKRFLSEAHRRNLKVITELVINHTSDQHPWFQRARKAPKGSPERDFYVWNDNPEKYKEARIIFQDFEASNWTWDREANSYFWHRFYSHQPDLNFENPQVHKEIFRVLDFWLKMGVDGVRLDAIPYLYEEEGTVCENLPQTHAFLKKLRAYVDEHYKDRMLLAEANQWPEDAANYFGEGDECHMAFHFPVMPRLFMATHLEDSLPIIEIMGQTPPIPEGCQWALFLRNHDELTLEMVTDEERDYMFRVYAHDPQARLNLGIRRRLAPLLKNDRRKIELMNSLLFSLIGTPVLYYGDELGMGDNIYLGDRNGVRTPMQWSSDRNAGFSRANPQALYLPPIIDPEYHYETVNVEAQSGNPHSLLWWTKQLISLRKRFNAFGYGTTEFLVPENRKVLVFFREHEDELILIVSNLSRFAQFVELDLSQHAGSDLVELFSGQRFPKIGNLPYFLTLGPYGYYWFAIEKEVQPFHIRPEFTGKIDEMNVRQERKAIFDQAHRQQLEGILYRYLRRKAWFQPFLPNADRSRLKVEDMFILPEGLHVVILQVGFTDGVVRRYPFFLAFADEADPEVTVLKVHNLAKKTTSLLVDRIESASISRVFANLIKDEKRIKGENKQLRGVPVEEGHDPVPFLIGQGNTVACREEGSILFPFQEGVLKLFTELEEGMNLDVEMRLFLTYQTEFRNFLPILGYVEYTDHAAVALAEEIAFYQVRFSAEERAIESAERFLISMEGEENNLPPSESWLALSSKELPEQMHRVLEGYLEDAHLLGKTTASFHLSMLGHSDSNFSELPFSRFYQRSLYQTIRKKVVEGMNHLRISPNASEVHAYRDRLLQKMQLLSRSKILATRLRLHGHFKLHNLFYTGKDFLIANFEGNPRYTYSERRYKRNPLVDIANMLFSFWETALLAAKRVHLRGEMGDVPPEKLKKWAHTWTMWIGSSFLRSYFRQIGDVSFLPESEKERDYLLLLFLIEVGMEKVIEEGRSAEFKIEAAVELLLHVLPLFEEIEL